VEGDNRYYRELHLSDHYSSTETSIPLRGLRLVVWSDSDSRASLSNAPYGLLSSSFHMVKVEAGQAALISGTRSCGSGHSQQAELEFQKIMRAKSMKMQRDKRRSPVSWQENRRLHEAPKSIAAQRQSSLAPVSLTARTPAGNRATTSLAKTSTFPFIINFVSQSQCLDWIPLTIAHQPPSGAGAASLSCAVTLAACHPEFPP
jgi:hypothetical protein